jgi:hypothetical protein
MHAARRATRFKIAERLQRPHHSEQIWCDVTFQIVPYVLHAGDFRNRSAARVLYVLHNGKATLQLKRPRYLERVQHQTDQHTSGHPYSKETGMMNSEWRVHLFHNLRSIV